MSRIRQEISSVQFQIDARKANASMQALQSAATGLNEKITETEEKIRNLGNVAPDNANLLKFRKELKGYKSDLRDVEKAQRDLVKGVKAADQLFKEAQVGKIERLSIKSIEAGKRGLQQRMKNLNADDAEDAKTMRAYKAVIEEADIVIKKFESDAKYLVDTINQGGEVSKSALTRAKSDLEDLLTMTQRGSKEWKEYNAQLTTVETTLNKIKTEDARTSGQKILGQAFRGDFAKADAKTLENVIAKLKEYKAVVDDPSGTGSRHIAAVNSQIEILQASLNSLKGGFASADEVMTRFNEHLNAGSTAGATSRRLTLEQMQEGIKLLEEEYAKTEHTTEAGIKRRSELRSSIDQMNEEIKVATGEWMSYADAEKMASQAGGQGFIATTQQMQQATQALERRRDMLIKTIQKQKESGAATANEEAQLKKVEAELKKVKFEMDNTGMSAQRMEEILENPRSAKNIEELGMAVKRSQAQLKLMEDTIGKGNKLYEEQAEKTKKAAQAQKELETQFKASTTAFSKAWSRLKTYIGLYMGAAVALQKLTGTLSDLMELSDKMGEVRKTTGFTADEVGRLSESLKRLDTRTTITGLLDLSVAAGQLGLKTQKDVEGFTIAANKLMVALPEMGKEGATEMLKVALATGEIDKIRKQMEEGIIEGSSATAVAMEKVGSTIDRLRATSAATAPAITDFVKRVGAVGAQSGITIDQVAALGSTVDALGMRVEMSATALSRMIPAIKNNAFDVAKAIGVTPDTLRNLFETGRGMEAILMIFQHIKDAGMDENSIESMLGMGNMKEIMKELNQQGARAGIVFAGLSQNVDQLRQHLGTASEAYEENIAIQQEYDKMNETTAAKWERLKNQLEEMFVGDASRRWLGGIIDNLRAIVDFIAADGPIVKGLKIIGIYIAAIKLNIGSAFMGAGAGLKNLWTAVKATAYEFGVFTRATAAAREEYKKMDAAMKQNIWGAIAALIAYAVIQLVEWSNKVKETRRQIGEMANEMIKAEEAVEKNFKAVEKANDKIDEANKKLKEAKDALEKARKEMDGTKKSADRLAEAEKNVKKVEDEVKIAKDGHRAAIEKLNKLYSPYLNFVLSEISSKKELANAQEIVNNKLREAIILRQKEAAISRVESESGEDRDTAYGKLSEQVRALMIGTTTTKTKGKNGKTTTTTQKVANTKENEKLLKDITKLAQETSFIELSVSEQQKRVKALLKGTDYENYGAMIGRITSYARNYATEYQKVNKKVKDVETQFDAQTSAERDEAQEKLKQQYTESTKTYTKLESDYAKATGNAKKQAAANLLKQADTLESMISGSSNYYDLTNDDEKAAYEKFISDTEKRIAGIKSQREKLLKEAGSLYKPIAGGGGGGGGGGSTNLWGTNPDATSTDYATWDVNELVARRNQMDKFKNVLKPDTDIRAVLAEDKALMKALDNGLKEDWKSVLGWYNQERLKIQEELKSERFSTNEGHWRDEKKSGGRKNRFRESDYALAELDRYYSKRKEMLEEARVKENMSEELFNRQAELLEQEHLERRKELRSTFTAGNTKEEKEMVKQFREWWKTLEKEGKLDNVPWATVESEWSKAIASEIGRNNLKAQQDMTQMEQITVKHLNAIARIIEKERPYDGIVANLRKNLTDMDILLADVQKNGPAEDPALLMKEQTARLQFLLGEAEMAYQSTINDVLKRMADAGMTAWAEEISNSEAMKNALMAQLQSAYDAIQEAIKKESSQIKKQMDIWWNDLIPGQDTSRKGGFEKTLSRLGLQEDQVKRANALIGAGAASERVADKLAIKQMQIRLSMQQVYYNKMRQMWDERIAALRAQGKEIDAQHAEISKQLSLSEEQKKLDEQRVAIANQLEESQNRLYTQLREWGDLLASSVRELMEASNAGNAEYFNELAKLNLTGKGGPGAGTYVVIDNAGTEDAKAHYEYLDERAALERQHEIEVQNAQAEAWKKVMDDLNAKMNEQITDWINAQLQNQAVYENTEAVNDNVEALGANTQAIAGLTGAILSQSIDKGAPYREGGNGKTINGGNMGTDENGVPNALKVPEKTGTPTGYGAPWQQTQTTEQTTEAEFISPLMPAEAVPDYENSPWAKYAENRELATKSMLDSQKKELQGQKQTEQQMVKGSQSTFAKMALAANMYGIAYQAVSNDNLNATQKFEMIALQATGNAAIAGLNAAMAKAQADAAANTPSVLGKLWSQLGWAAAPVFAIFTGLLGGLMGMASSRIAKSKSEIAQATGASGANAGRLTTGMLTYAEGNVNEFTDPSTLTPGRQYNVDAADGRTYRARYMGSNPRTHITNGPEFHLSGERGREMIIDAGTTRQITMNDGEIWRTIQTLSAGGRLSATRRRGRGVRAFADGNVEDFMETADGGGMMSDGMDLTAIQGSLDRNTAVQEALLERLNEPIVAQNIWHGPEGIPNMYNKMQKEAKRHGEKFV